MAHFRTTAASLLVALVVPVAAGAASAQAVGSVVFAGQTVPASQFQYPATSLLSGPASYAPSMMIQAMDSPKDVVPVSHQAVTNGNSGAAAHGYKGSGVILDDAALASVR
jgi:hypothetical protein